MSKRQRRGIKALEVDGLGADGGHDVPRHGHGRRLGDVLAVDTAEDVWVCQLWHPGVLALDPNNVPEVCMLRSLGIKIKYQHTIIIGTLSTSSGF